MNAINRGVSVAQALWRPTYKVLVK